MEIKARSFYLIHYDLLNSLKKQNYSFKKAQLVF